MIRCYTLAAILFVSLHLSAQLTFDPAVTVSRSTSQVGVADVDGDGTNDLLIAGGTQRWRKGPAFTTEYTLGISNGGPYAARTADIDGDGDPDWVTSNGARNSGDVGEIYVYLNPGGSGATGSWQRTTVYTGPGRHINDMVIADVDLDGKLDIVVKTWEDSDRLIIVFQDSPSAWTPRVIATGETGTKTEGVAVGEIEGGGLPEIIQAGFYYSATNWRTATPTSTNIATRFTAQEMKAGVGDFDGDGDQDVYMASAEGNPDLGAYWYRNDGGGSFPEQIIEAGIGKLHMHDVLDVDGDGDTDIVAGQSFSETGIFIYYNDGAGGFTKNVVDGNGQFYTGVAADLDADGDLDLVGPRKFYNGNIGYYINTGTATPPVAPSGATATLTAGGAEVDLSWTDNASDEAAYQVERQATGNAWNLTATLVPNAMSYTDQTTAPGTTYSYRVRATNSGGASAYATTGTVTTFAQAGAVTISPGSGNYSTPPNVTLTAAAPSDEIRYTLDGTDPTASSALYASPISVATSAELRAASFGVSLQRSSVSSETYNVAVGGNFAPVANAGPDATYNTLDPVTLDASASSDLDHTLGELSFAWVQTAGPGVVLYAASTSMPNFTPTGFGSYTFEVTVSDPVGASDVDEVTITVEDLDAALIAYWKLDDGSGTTATDERGNYNGTLSTGASFVSGGQQGGAVSLDGTQGKIDVPAFDITGSALTLSCWVNPASFNNVEGRFISKADGSSANDHLWMLSQIGGTGVRFRLKTSANANTTTLASSTGQLTANAWTFVAATYDGAEMRLYVDGVQVTSTAKTGTIATDPTVAIALGNQPAGDRPFEGLMDDVRIYDRALTAQEISEAFSAPPLAAAVQDFTAMVLAGQTHLTWSSVDELGVVAYHLERSSSGLGDGDRIGSLTAQAAQPVAKYSYIDAEPVLGTSYYRFVRVHEDGELEPSAWAAVQHPDTSPFGKTLLVYPNPTTGLLILEASEADYEVQLIDHLGRVVSTETVVGDQPQLDLTRLPTGSYILQIPSTAKQAQIEVVR